MTSRTAAARYARALLDVATKESVDLDAIARELDEFIAFLEQQPALAGLMLNPRCPRRASARRWNEITKVSGFSPIVAKLLILLADRDRLVLLKDVSATYRDLLADRQNVVRAEVTSAEPLSNDRLQVIEQRLAARHRQARGDDDQSGQGHHRRDRRARRQHGLRRQHRHAVEEDQRTIDDIAFTKYD